uniref:Putative cytotoxin-like protein n=1 Tax=Ixodes ricinus TaxID=34613 RepID=A0A6B0V9G5_IXORI
MGAFVSQAILLASLHVSFGEEASQFIFDLEKTVERYANEYAKRHGTTVQFFDISAKREELKHRPVYKRHKLTVTATNFQLGEPIGEHYPPTQVYTATFTNGQGSSDTIQTVSQTYTNTESTTTKLVKGFQTNYQTSVTIGVPLVTNVGGKYSFDYSLSRTKLDIETKTETLQIEVKVAVPPKSTVQVTWYVTNKVMDFPWSATVIVRGWFAVWFNNPVEGHNLWFFTVSVLAKIDDNLTVIDHLTVSFQAEGVFRSVATHDSRVFVYELRSSEREKQTTKRPPKAKRMPPPLE